MLTPPLIVRWVDLCYRSYSPTVYWSESLVHKELFINDVIIFMYLEYIVKSQYFGGLK